MPMLKTPRWPCHGLGLADEFRASLEVTPELEPDDRRSTPSSAGHVDFQAVDLHKLVHPQGTSRFVTWTFSVLMEAPVTERKENSLVGKTTYFGVRVICHERPVYKDRYAGCREYSWRVRRRYSDFEGLDNRLRSTLVLPPSIVLPKKATFWNILASEDCGKLQRAEDLHKFLTEVLDALQVIVSNQPDRYRDVADVCPALLKFLGMQEMDRDDNLHHYSGLQRRLWAPPKSAEERHAALIHSLDRGVYIWGHERPGSPRTRLTRFDRQAVLGDLPATYAEARRPSVAMTFSTGILPPAPLGSENVTPLKIRPPAISSPPFGFSSPPLSLFSSPAVSRMPTPASSPGNSRCPSPPRTRCNSAAGEDFCSTVLSFTSTSTADTEQSSHCGPPVSAKTVAAVWTEADVDLEWSRCQDHKKWWISVLGQRGAETKAVRGASRVDSVTALPSTQDRVDGRRSAIVHFEKAAALFRQLSSMQEDLHPILGYGVEGKSLVIVQQVGPVGGLRALPFTQQRCHRILGQLLKALDGIHRQQLVHGHLSPEGILIEEGPLGPQARVTFAPGQRRPEGRCPATLGFRGPGFLNCPSGDIWAFACIVLVWWMGFSPVPHPWTQFAKSGRLQQDINKAMAEPLTAMPKALLEMHLAAANAEEPEHTFFSLLASLLTRCLCHQPSERPSACQLLQHPFFEQAL